MCKNRNNENIKKCAGFPDENNRAHTVDLGDDDFLMYFDSWMGFCGMARADARMSYMVSMPDARSRELSYFDIRTRGWGDRVGWRSTEDIEKCRGHG